MIYPILFPVVESKWIPGWSRNDAHGAEVAAARQKYLPLFRHYASMPISQLTVDDQPSHGAIEMTIANGWKGLMPADKALLGEEKVHILAAYVYSSSQ